MKYPCLFLWLFNDALSHIISSNGKNCELGTMCKKASLLRFKALCQHFREGVRKTMRGLCRDNRPPCRETYPGSPLSEGELVTRRRRCTVHFVIVLTGCLSHCTGESLLHWTLSCKCDAKHCPRPSLSLEQNAKFFFLRSVRSTAEFKTTSFKLETKFKKKL
jgi:hypothetical protein